MKFNCTTRTLEPAMAAPLTAGQASFHHWQLVHASGSNRSGQERVGLAVRYMAADVSSAGRGGAAERVTLVSGVAAGAWEWEEGISTEYGEREWEQHRLGLQRVKQNYFAGTSATAWK